MPQQPISMQLVTTIGCANCVKAQKTVADMIARLQGEYPIAFSEFSLTEHPELLTQHDIWGTPALIIDDELAFVGTISERQLREKLAIVAAGR